MDLAELRDRSVVLLGVGEETLSVLGALRAAGITDLQVVEPGDLRADQAERLRAAGLDPSAVLDALPGQADVVLRSPGFPAHRRDVAALSAAAGLATTPTGLWLAVRGGRRTVVVTGTKGKSTTATLIVEGLRASGVDATLAGNIGTSPWTLDPRTDEVVVVELSSYHGADLLATGEVAVLTLLADDHLDWHGSADQYRRDKLRVLTIDQADGTPPSHRIALASQRLPQRFEHLIDRVDGGSDHQTGNVALAAAAIRAELGLLGVAPPEPATLLATLESSYPNLPSRFEVIAEIAGVRWIDDALASNPSATAAALERLAPGPATLICGGHDRHVSLEPVVRRLDTWPDDALTIVWLGDADERFRQLAALPAVGIATVVPDLADGVIMASLTVESGGSVVFSPLAPTERSEGTWIDRSRAFHVAVARLGP